MESIINIYILCRFFIMNLVVILVVMESIINRNYEEVSFIISCCNPCCNGINHKQSIIQYVTKLLSFYAYLYLFDIAPDTLNTSIFRKSPCILCQIRGFRSYTICNYLMYRKIAKTKFSQMICSDFIFRTLAKNASIL